METCLLDQLAQMAPLQLTPMPRSIEIHSYRRHPLLPLTYVGGAALVVGSA